MQRITSVAELKEGTTYYMASLDVITGKEIFKRAAKFLKASQIFKKKVLDNLENAEEKYVDYQILTWQHISCCTHFKDCTEPGKILDMVRKRSDGEKLLKEKIQPFKTDAEITDDMVWDRIKYYIDYPNGCPFEFSFEFIDNKKFVSKFNVPENIYVRNQKSVHKRYFVIALINIGFEFTAADTLADEFFPRDIYDKTGIFAKGLPNRYRL